MTAVILKSLQQARRLIIAVTGFTVLIAGIVMIVFPGPAIIVIPAGLAILATEFIWARRLLKMAKNTFSNIKKGGNSNETK